MLTIDGSMGEGGGQILRSALGLSLVTGKPFRIDNIRKKRNKSGLMRQHLTCVQAAARIGRAKVDGDNIGSLTVTFEPEGIEPGDYHFAIGTAGSTSLVLQAVLPALLVASGPSRLVIEGGTHNPWCPPFDFLTHSFLPLLARMGANVEIELERPGFYPAGGGRIVVSVEPVDPERGLSPLHLHQRGALVRRRAVAHVANLPRSIAERELKVVGQKLQFKPDELEIREIPESQGPGNILTIQLEFEQVTEVFTGFGELAKPAEKVASDAVRDARNYLKSDAPIGLYLADQLLLPIAMAGAGSFRTLPLTRHTQTNIAVLKTFLPVDIRHEQADRMATLEISSTSGA